MPRSYGFIYLLLLVSLCAANIQKLYYYAHAPKTGGTALLSALKACVGNCSNPRSYGPNGQYVNDFTTVGLLDPVDAEKGSLWCTDPASHNPRTYGCNESRMENNVLCGFIHHHWPYKYSMRLKLVAEKANLTAIPLCSVRHPFEYYISHYFYALKSQHQSKPNSGGLPWFGPEHEVCLGNKRSSAACVATFRTWLTERFLTKHSMVSMMTRLYGNRFHLCTERGWIRLETMVEDAVSVVQWALGKNDNATAACLRKKLGKPSPKQKWQTYFNKALEMASRVADAEIFRRFYNGKG